MKGLSMTSSPRPFSLLSRDMGGVGCCKSRLNFSLEGEMIGLVCMVKTQVGREAYLGGRDEGGVGVCLVKDLLAGGDITTDDRLDTVVGNLRLTGR